MPVNVKIQQIETAEKSSVKLVREEATLRKEFSKDGLDGKEKKKLAEINGKIKKLKDLVAKLRKEIELNKRAWEGRKSDFQNVQTQIGDLKAWPDPEAGGLEKDAGAIDQATSDQRWKDATDALGELERKIAPIYKAYEAQVAAKEACGPIADDIRDRIVKAGDSHPLSDALKDLLTDFESEFAKAEDLGAKNEWIDEKTSLEALIPTLGGIEDQIKELAKQKEEFDKAWGDIQSALNETTVCEFPALVPMQEEIQTIRGHIEDAALVFDYEKATPMVADLSTKIDTYMAEYAKSVDARTLYESRLPRIETELAEASVSEFPALSEIQGKIADKAGAMEKFAEGGEYEKALLEMDALVPLLDEYKLAYENALLGQEYERLYAEMEPDFAACAVSTFGPLDDLAADIADDQQKAASEGGAGAYQSAIDILNAAKDKIDEWHGRFAEIDAAKADYDRRIKDVLDRFDAIASCEYPQLTKDAETMVALRTKMEGAAETGDYITALAALEELDKLIISVTGLLDMLDAKRAEYEKNAPGVIVRFDGLMTSDFAELEDERKALEQARTDMETAATARDFPLAVDHMGVVERLLDDLEAQLGKLIDLRNQYEELYLKIKKDLAEVEACKHVELESKRTEILSIRDAMLAAATATDFTVALEKAKELVPLLVEFAKLEELLKKYLSSLAVVEPQLKEVRAITYKSMEDDKKEIEKLYKDMTEKAAAAKIAEALEIMPDLQKKVSEALLLFKELQKNEPVFDKLLSDLKPQIKKVEDCEIEDKTIEAEKKAVLKAFEKLEELGEKDEFIEGIKKADEINKVLLPKFIDALDKHGDQMEAFLLMKDMADSAYEKAEKKAEEYEDDLEDAFEKLTTLKEAMDGFEKDEKWAEAKAKAKALLDAIKTFDVEWSKVAKREASLKADAKTQTDRYDNLPKKEAEEKAASEYKEAGKLKSKIEDALKDKEFDDAEEAIGDLKDKLDEIDEALMTEAEHEAKYEGRRDSLKSLVKQATESKLAKYLTDKVEEVETSFKAMVDTAERDKDFEAAVDKADDVDDALDAFDKAEMEISNLNVRLDERMDGLEKRYQEAKDLKVEELQSRIDALPGKYSDANEEVKEGKFDASKTAFDDRLKKALELRNEVESILDRAEEIEDKEAERGPGGEIGDKVDDIADKGKDLIDKIQDKAKDFVIDKGLDYIGGKAKGVYHAVDSGIDAADSLLDAADNVLDGDFGDALDDLKDAGSSALDSASEVVQLHPVSDGIKKGVEIAKEVKDVAEDLLDD